MYTLINWYILMHKDRCIAWGIVSGHHKLTDGTFVHTSVVKRVTIDEEHACLLVHTKSGSCYRLSFADIDFNEMENTRDSLRKIKVSVDFLSQCEALYADFEAKKRAEADKILNKKELLLEMFGVSTHRAYFKDGLGILHKIEIFNHLGMFQDSVLVTDWDSGLVDFRYFPNDNIRPYHWSDGLEAVKIKNSGRERVVFSGRNREIVCQPGEIAVVGRDA